MGSKLEKMLFFSNRKLHLLSPALGRISSLIRIFCLFCRRVRHLSGTNPRNSSIIFVTSSKCELSLCEWFEQFLIMYFGLIWKWARTWRTAWQNLKTVMRIRCTSLNMSGTQTLLILLDRIFWKIDGWASLPDAAICPSLLVGRSKAWFRTQHLHAGGDDKDQFLQKEMWLHRISFVFSFPVVKTDKILFTNLASASVLHKERMIGWGVCLRSAWIGQYFEDI